MTKKVSKSKIIKGNKLIAEFIGLIYNTKKNYTGWYNSNGTRLCDSDGLRYHYSMDMLMPVLNKIHKLIIVNDEEIVIELYEKLPNELCTFVSIGSKIETSHANLIMAVWLAVVKYIELNSNN